MADFGRFSRFWPWNLLPVELSTCPKFFEMKRLASQLHFAVWIKFMALKLEHLIPLKSGGFWLKWLWFWILTCFLKNSDFVVKFSQTSWLSRPDFFRIEIAIQMILESRFYATLANPDFPFELFRSSDNVWSLGWFDSNLDSKLLGW